MQVQTHQRIRCDALSDLIQWKDTKLSAKSRKVVFLTEFNDDHVVDSTKYIHGRSLL